MYTFIYVLLVISIILCYLFTLVLMAMEMGFWVSSEKEGRYQIACFLVYVTAPLLLFNGIKSSILILIILPILLFIIQFLFFKSYWKDLADSLICKRNFFLVIVATIGLLFGYRACDNYVQKYEWEHSTPYCVVRYETRIEQEEEYEIINDTSVYLGKVDVEKKYVILSDSSAHCIEETKRNAKKVHHSALGDTVWVFKGKIVTKPKGL